jgi:hypothetical protein
MSIKELPSITKAVKIAEQIRRIKTGEITGFSLSTDDLSPAPNYGYMVGMGHGEFTASELDNEEIIVKLTAIIDMPDSQYVGAWSYAGNIVIEGSTRFTKLSISKLIAKNRDQIAIYDLANQEDINL